MSQHEQETAFLQKMLNLDCSEQRRLLQSQLDEAERCLRCIRRAASRVAFLMVFCCVGAGYGTVFLPGIIERRPHFLMQFFYTVLTACLISLVIYAIYWLRQSHHAGDLREQCRQFLLGRTDSLESVEARLFPGWSFRNEMPRLTTSSRSLTPVVSSDSHFKAP